MKRAIQSVVRGLAQKKNQLYMREIRCQVVGEEAVEPEPGAHIHVVPPK
jgi:hypothetical protein